MIVIVLLGGMAAAAGALLNTGSLFLSVWTFFLVQALHPLIPALTNSRSRHDAKSDRRFNQALRSAESAIRRIHQQPTV